MKELDPYDLLHLLEEAAKPELAAIDHHFQRAPDELRPLFRLLRTSLCESKLSLKNVRDAVKMGDRALSSAFRRVTGQPPWSYVRDARLGIAARLMLQTSLEVTQIARLVGYKSVGSFRTAFGTFAGMPPRQYVRRARRLVRAAGPAPRGLYEQAHWKKALAGELADEEARELDEYLDALYPSAPPAPASSSHPLARLRRDVAEALAASLPHLSWADQRRLVRESVWFFDPTFFSVLSRRSLEAAAGGDAERGVELALLAVDSLTPSGLIEIRPNLAALAWARVAAARWRAADPAGAEEALRQSAKDLDRAAEEDLVAAYEAERTYVEAAFRWFQGRRDEALELAESSVARHRAAPSPNLGAALWLRAEIRATFPEQLRGALADLEEARDGVEVGASRQHKLSFLDLWVRVLVQLGDGSETATALPEVRRLAAELGEDGGRARLRWLEGHASPPPRDPKSLIQEAGEELAERGEDLWAARCTLDLARLAVAGGRHGEVPALASSLAGTLGALADSSESLAVVRRLGDGEAAADAVAEAEAVLSRWEWDSRARRAVRFVESGVLRV